MNQEIEIEFKNIVSERDFQKLCNAFNITEEQFLLQTNHYFDTTDFQLKKLDCAVRIREKNNTCKLTLKQPHNIGLLETHETLSVHEVNKAIREHSLPRGYIAKYLFDHFQIHLSDCRYLGTLCTNRAQCSYKDGTLVFDHSHYLDVEDFEIEYETKDEIIGKAHFYQLLQHYQIPITKTENKIKRFFQRKLTLS